MPMTEVTRILSAIEQGEPNAAEQLLPLVYEELRKLAAQKLAQEKAGQTLQATALVHEAYLRLVDVDKAQQWNSRGHFFAAAAEAMRRILVDNARLKHCKKRGGDHVRLDLDQLAPATSERLDDVLDIDAALAGLANGVTCSKRGTVRRAEAAGFWITAAMGEGVYRLQMQCNPLIAYGAMSCSERDRFGHFAQFISGGLPACLDVIHWQHRLGNYRGESAKCALARPSEVKCLRSCELG
jgi:RNA polymerase sigma factor (TIGR02999 family)